MFKMNLENFNLKLKNYLKRKNNGLNRAYSQHHVHIIIVSACQELLVSQMKKIIEPKSPY